MTAKMNPQGQYSDLRADGTTIYYRTGKGSHRHANAFCANSKREITTGDITIIPADEASNWEPCIDCCPEADVKAAAEVAAAKAAATCTNSGIMHPGRGRLYDDCKDCGKNGKVNRSTGRLRAHKPAAK
jgi:hypothetical protein